MSVIELKKHQKAATETVNRLKERLKQKRLQWVDGDGQFEGYWIFFPAVIALLTVVDPGFNFVSV